MFVALDYIMYTFYNIIIINCDILYSRLYSVLVTVCEMNVFIH